MEPGRWRIPLRTLLIVVALLALVCTVVLQATRIRQLQARLQVLEARDRIYQAKRERELRHDPKLRELLR